MAKYVCKMDIHLFIYRFGKIPSDISNAMLKIYGGRIFNRHRILNNMRFRDFESRSSEILLFTARASASDGGKIRQVKT